MGDTDYNYFVQIVLYKVHCGYELTKQEQIWWDAHKEEYNQAVERLMNDLTSW